MAKHVKIATISFNAPNIQLKPADISVAEYMANWIEDSIRPVLPDKPDLIVLPECADRPSNMTSAEIVEYYKERGSVVLDRMRTLARENHTYVAYSAVREMDDGSRRNSVIMLGRDGETVGIYDKNYPMVHEISDFNVLPGEDIAVFECDFGRVGALICFDMNFEELRIKYREADVDLIIFSSMFNGGVLHNFFAVDTKSYLVSACGKGRPAEIISPLGECISTTTDYYPYTVCDVNLDYDVVHLDYNREKFDLAKAKYGSDFSLTVISYLGRAIIASEREDMTARDFIKEFDIERFDDYFARSRAAREEKINK